MIFDPVCPTEGIHRSFILFYHSRSDHGKQKVARTLPQQSSRARCKTLSYTKAPAFPKKGLAGASVCVTIKV
jgi:hypothetical protein